MGQPVTLLDEKTKDEIRRYPTVELIKRLFPDVKMRGRATMCNPLRGERNASLSCYRGRDGYPMWKDHTTGAFGDNIDFFRMARPELGYLEAVDELSWMLLGHGAVASSSREARVSAGHAAAPSKRTSVREVPSALQIISDEPLVAVTSSDGLVGYWRSRAVSDEVAARYGRRVVFENTNRKGRVVRDDYSGLPVFTPDGEPLLDDGHSEAVALPNDIGGYSLRVPESEGRKGFKGCDVAFVSTLYADGSRPGRRVVFAGAGEGRVEGFGYDEQSRFLFVNGTQGFSGVEPWAARFAVPFLENWTGRYLEGRDLKGAVAVLNALNGPVNTCVTVVEGMFDALSVIELQRRSGRGSTPGSDLVVLNSVSNLFWSVPFLAMHREVRSLLDNDLRSGAGQRTFDLMSRNVSEYAARCMSTCAVRSDSGFFYPCKDVNDYLVRITGSRPSALGDGQKKKMTEPKAATRRPATPKKVGEITF